MDASEASNLKRLRPWVEGTWWHVTVEICCDLGLLNWDELDSYSR